MLALVESVLRRGEEVLFKIRSVLPLDLSPTAKLVADLVCMAKLNNPRPYPAGEPRRIR
jgi:hypothetical protein